MQYNYWLYLVATFLMCRYYEGDFYCIQDNCNAGSITIYLYIVGGERVLKIISL